MILKRFIFCLRFWDFLSVIMGFAADQYYQTSAKFCKSVHYETFASSYQVYYGQCCCRRCPTRPRSQSSWSPRASPWRRRACWSGPRLGTDLTWKCKWEQKIRFGQLPMTFPLSSLRSILSTYIPICMLFKVACSQIWPTFILGQKRFKLFGDLF